MRPIAVILGKSKYYFSLMRKGQSRGGVSLVRQLLEIAYLWRLNGIHPSDYFAAGLDGRGKSFREKREYVLHGRYLRLVRRANREEYQFVVLNKIATYGLLNSFGVPTPRFYGLINAANGQAYDGKPLRTPNDLLGLLRRIETQEICFKPLGSWGGAGFLKVTLDHREGDVAVVKQPDGARMTVDEFWISGLGGVKGSSYICQEVIHQHEDLARIHPWSVNTARIWMYQLELGHWEVFEAVLRLGMNSSPVDNTSAGGIVARIDARTGMVAAAIDEEPERGVYADHPTTGERIEGVVLPMWEDVLHLAVRTCRVFPYFRLLGLDIAFGSAGPVVVELECEPGAGHQIVFGRGAKSLLSELAKRGPLGWRQ